MNDQMDKAAAANAKGEGASQEIQETFSGRRRPRERRRERHRHAPHEMQQSSRPPEPAINMNELREVIGLIASHGFTDFELERDNFRVRLRRELTPQIVHAAPAQNVIAPTAPPVTASENAATQSTTVNEKTATGEAEDDEKDLHVITSPIVGTFYRSPAPGAENFVKVGAHVEHDTVVCIIEAMKLMNEIQAETVGTVAKIYVENGQPVEYGQPLFGIKK